ncbi:MAG: adenosylhomocysteinase, partial [Oscillospiraceae bacterium]
EAHFPLMKDGAILCNAGHFNVEINLPQLEKLSKSHYEARNNIEGYVMPDGREIFVLAKGRLVNLASGDGHPAEIMDMSFAIQALSAKYLADNRGKLPLDVIEVPREIDLDVAQRKLAAMHKAIDTLSDYQKKYMGK